MLLLVSSLLVPQKLSPGRSGLLLFHISDGLGYLLVLFLWLRLLDLVTDHVDQLVIDIVLVVILLKEFVDLNVVSDDLFWV